MAGKYDIIGFGECLIDFLTTQTEGDAKITMVGTAGGAPLNVLAAASKLGRSTAYITKVGSDVFGRFLIDRVTEAGVEYRGRIAEKELTTLAIVTLDETGDRDFAFYRNGTAEATISVDDLDYDLLSQGRIFHFGTVSMTNDIIFEATVSAARSAKEAGAKISFDPNYRTFIWDNESDALEAMDTGFRLADYIKVSEEEAELITGLPDPDAAAGKLMERYQPEFLAVTLGPLGSVARSSYGSAKEPAFDVQVVDTTAAGDGFWGAALHKLLSYNENGTELTDAALSELLIYANAAGSHAAASAGAIPSLATEADILGHMRGR
jgi:fructokinase